MSVIPVSIVLLTMGAILVASAGVIDKRTKTVTPVVEDTDGDSR